MRTSFLCEEQQFPNYSVFDENMKPGFGNCVYVEWFQIVHWFSTNLQSGLGEEVKIFKSEVLMMSI